MSPRPSEVHGDPKVAVVCLGSPLHGDDEAGLIACRVLEELLPPGVRIVEAGTDSSRVAGLLAKGYRVIIVDAVRLEGAEPGDVVVVEDPAVIEARHPPGSHGILLPPGDPSKLRGRVMLVGIVVGRVELGAEPSARVVEGAVRAAELITETLSLVPRGGGAEDTRNS